MDRKEIVASIETCDSVDDLKIIKEAVKFRLDELQKKAQNNHGYVDMSDQVDRKANPGSGKAK